MDAAFGNVVAENDRHRELEIPSGVARVHGDHDSTVERDCRLLAWVAKTSKKELYVYVSMVLGFGLLIGVLWDLSAYAFSERSDLSTQTFTDGVLVSLQIKHEYVSDSACKGIPVK